MDEASLAELVQRVATTFSLDLEEATVLRQGRGTVVRVYSRGGRVTGTLIAKVFQPAYKQPFVRERAGLGLLSGLPELDGFVPQLLGEDEETLTLLIADIPEQAPYADLITSPAVAAAKVALTDTAQRLGILHGYARKLVADFHKEVEALPSPGSQLRGNVDATLSFLRRALASGASDVESLEFAYGSAVHKELLNVAECIDEPSALSTITVGDMAPSNVLLGPHGPAFIDLEYCAVRRPFYDAMFWHCIYPLPSPIADQMDIAYFQGLRSSGIQIREEAFYQAMFLFMSHRLFWTLSWNMEPLLTQDREIVPGVSMRLTLLAYLQEYSRFAKKIDLSQATLPAVATRLDERLRRHWSQSIS